MNNDMIVQEQNNALSVIEGLSLNKVQDSMVKIQQFQKIVQSTLVEGHDYGASFYGAPKPSLLKPGAEKILMLLGLSSEYEMIEKIQDYDEGFFAYTIRCKITKNGQLIAEGLGHCNSREKKYTHEKQDIYMLGNTCLKMAKKRAQVDATLTVASLSDIFTQDLEDMAQFEQSERMETMNANDAKSVKVNFGKYKGETLGQILVQDIGYVKWLSKNARDESMRKAADMLLNDSGNPSDRNNNEKQGLPPEEKNEANITEGFQDESDDDIPF